MSYEQRCDRVPKIAYYLPFWLAIAQNPIRKLTILGLDAADTIYLHRRRKLLLSVWIFGSDNARLINADWMRFYPIRNLQLEVGLSMNYNSVLKQVKSGAFLGSLALIVAAFQPSVYAKQADSISTQQSAVTAEKQLAQNEPSMGSPGEEEAELPVSTSNWQAFEDRMPIGFPNLYVTGQVSLPNPGYDAELVRPLEQDYTDESLTLVLVVNEPSRRFPIQPTVIEEETVRYEDEFYLGDYENVIIRGEDGSVLETIDIQVVQ